jgi:hypothetical protein
MKPQLSFQFPHFTIVLAAKMTIFCHEWLRGMAQVVDCLPSKLKALSSNPSTAKYIYINIFIYIYIYIYGLQNGLFSRAECTEMSQVLTFE